MTGESEGERPELKITIRFFYMWSNFLCYFLLLFINLFSQIFFLYYYFLNKMENEIKKSH